MIVYVARRLLYGCAVVIATAFFAYGGMRFLKPDHPDWRDIPWATYTWPSGTSRLRSLTSRRQSRSSPAPGVATWAKAANRVLNEKVPVDKAVDEMIARIMTVAG